MKMKRLRKIYKNVTITRYGIRVNDYLYIQLHDIDEVNAMIWTLDKLGLYKR